MDFWILIKPHGTTLKYIDVNKKTSLALPSFIQQQHYASWERGRDRGEKEAIKIADCQRKKKRLGWMRKHAHHVKALGPFVLILSNADFLWVAEVAKSASVCQCICMCIQHVCMCVFRLFVHSWSQARLASAAQCMLLVWVCMNVRE